MVVRMWHRRLPTAKAERYREFLNTRAIPTIARCRATSASTFWNDGTVTLRTS